MFNGTGIGASNQFEAGGFIRTRDDDLWPNIQYHFLPVAINYNGSNAIKMHGFQAHVGLDAFAKPRAHEADVTRS